MKSLPIFGLKGNIMTKTITLIIFLVVAVLLFTAVPLFSADVLDKTGSFQCGSNIVSVGDTKAEVIIKCGQPTYQEAEGSKEAVKRGRQGSPLDYESEYKNVEQWYYNRGPNDFIYVLTFEGGTLRTIESRGYGK